MRNSSGYLVDLSTIKLNDSRESWIQALPIGTYTHPVYGVIKLTAERIARFAENVNKKVRGQDLDIDYDHKNRTDEAAGWVVQAESKNDGLWLLVSWTEKAANLIVSKAYKYFSAEFVDSWKDPKSGTTYNDVLFGGGITNRPFIKDMVPINLSEFFEGKELEDIKGEIMTDEQKKQLLAQLGLPETATDSEILAALLASMSKKEDEKEEMNEEKEDAPASQIQIPQLSEASFKLLSDQLNTLSTKLADAEKQLRDSTVKEQVLNLNELARANGFALAIPVRDKMTIALSDPTAKSVEDAFKSLLSKDSIVQLGETVIKKTDVEDKPFEEQVREFGEKNKLEYSDALLKFVESNPEAYNSYRNNLLESEN